MTEHHYQRTNNYLDAIKAGKDLESEKQHVRRHLSTAHMGLKHNDLTTDPRIIDKYAEEFACHMEALLRHDIYPSSLMSPNDIN